jgi:hypothetical protein
MAGRKGRSGPPGNLNGTRHPWAVFWRRRALRPEDRWILPVLEGYARSLGSDKPNMSEGERRMAEIAREARGARMLIWAEVGSDGHTTDERVALLTELPTFMSAEIRALLALGLERRAEKVADLDTYLKSKYPAVDGGGAEQVSTAAAGAVDPASCEQAQEGQCGAAGAARSEDPAHAKPPGVTEGGETI